MKVFSRTQWKALGLALGKAKGSGDYLMGWTENLRSLFLPNPLLQDTLWTLSGYTDTYNNPKKENKRRRTFMLWKEVQTL